MIEYIYANVRVVFNVSKRSKEMYKAIIADDEKNICELIRYLGDWEQLGIEVTAVCSDGESALETIMKEVPDIVLVDIRMPYYSGLELMAKVKEIYPDICFVIISGHRIFEYAQNAVQYGAIDYLLKPINQEELNRTLKRCCDKIAYMRNEKSDSYKARQIIKVKKENLQSELVSRIWDEKTEFCMSLQDISRNYELVFTNSFYRIITCKVNKKILQINETFTGKIKKIWDDIFHEYEYIASSDLIRTMFLICYNEEKRLELARNLEKIHVEILNLQDIYGQFSPRIFIGKEVCAFDEIGESAFSAYRAENIGIHYPKENFIYDEKYNSKLINTSITELVPAQMQKKFETDMELLDKEAIKADITDLFEKINNFHYETDPCLQRDAIETILTNAIKGVSHYNVSENKKQEILYELEFATSRYKLKVILEDELTKIIDELLDDSKQQESQPIRKAKLYIQEHYSEPVKLETIAEYVNFSPKYFSTIFKRSCGVSFSEYLTNVRIEKAKEKLRTTNASVKEIAIGVGYPDIHHFSKVFRKNVNIKPTDYRKLFQ